MSTIMNILTYFFEPIPSGQFKYLKLFIAFALIFLAGATVFKILIKKKKEDKIFKKLFKNLPGKMITIAILEGLYILCHYEKIPFLSMRIFNYIIILTAIYLIAKNIKTFLKDYPRLEKERTEQLKLNKYLPRKKR